jgi:hypothetical protein
LAHGDHLVNEQTNGALWRIEHQHGFARRLRYRVSAHERSQIEYANGAVRVGYESHQGVALTPQIDEIRWQREYRPCTEHW